jgi:hypothetical protein
MSKFNLKIAAPDMAPLGGVRLKTVFIESYDP